MFAVFVALRGTMMRPVLTNLIGKMMVLIQQATNLNRAQIKINRVFFFLSFIILANYTYIKKKVLLKVVFQITLVYYRIYIKFINIITDIAPGLTIVITLSMQVTT